MNVSVCTTIAILLFLRVKALEMYTFIGLNEWTPLQTTGCGHAMASLPSKHFLDSGATNALGSREVVSGLQQN